MKECCKEKISEILQRMKDVRNTLEMKKLLLAEPIINSHIYAIDWFVNEIKMFCEDNSKISQLQSPRSEKLNLGEDTNSHEEDEAIGPSKCDRCEKEAKYIQIANPFMKEIHDETKLENFCEDCYHECLMDI